MREVAPASRTAVRIASIVAGLAAAGCAQGGGATGNAHNGEIYDAWRDGRSHLEVTAAGSVARLLGTRAGPSGAHEGFLLHLTGGEGNGLTVRVEDNVDLTGPIPLREGAAVEVRGEYMYDARGGIVHYTHRDPRGRHPDGYILVDGKFFQ